MGEINFNAKVRNEIVFENAYTAKIVLEDA